MRSLLIVDDEPSVLSSLAYFFERQGYEALTADNPAQALNMIAAMQNIDDLGVVIADYRMPTMSGIELLHEVGQYAPEAKRILLTAKSDLVDAMDAVDQGGLFRFLAKPCSHESLLKVVEDAFVVFNSAKENQQLNAELKKANAQLKQLSRQLQARVENVSPELRETIYFDRLTGLPSMELIHDRLAVSIHAANRNDKNILIVSVGIENFNLINTNLGHDAGDELLQAFAQRLQSLIWEGDSVGRLHGDKFGLVINNTPPGEPANELVSRLLALLHQPFEINGQHIYLQANLGISVYPQDGSSPQDLLNRAEIARRQAKNDSESAFRFYTQALDLKVSERFLLQSQIRAALKNNEFKIHYQPRINVVTGRIIGVEALLRWQHPERGLLPPAEFLFLLEESGLIRQVGEWVLNTVCATVMSWQREVDHALHVAVNVSPIQLKSNSFCEMVRSAIAVSGIDLAETTLELEITENIFLSDLEHVKGQLNALREMGVRIAIDDFGTGYSSLSYLIKLPIHYLKIDRAFVIDVTKSADAKAIVRAITSLAQSLRLQVVAEGIETEDQLEAMRTLDCQEFQGFLFSRPVSAEVMRELLLADSQSDSPINLFEVAAKAEEQFYI